MVPDIPYSLDIKIKRERYLAKQALQVMCLFSKIFPIIKGQSIPFQDIEHKKDNEENNPGFAK